MPLTPTAPPSRPDRFRIEMDEPEEGRIVDAEGRFPSLRFSLDDVARDLAEEEKARIVALVREMNGRPLP
jgi:hypothetical protein